MKPCKRPGCDGTVDDTGYCDTCGHEDTSDSHADPRLSAPPGVPGGAEPGSPQRPTGESLARVHSVSSMTSELVSLPELPPEDPQSRIDPDPRPPAHGRPCGKEGCTGTIGGGHFGQPALSQGFCPICGTPYSFKPKLRPGEMVGQYEVIGCLAHGGFGWVYLARDTNLGGLYVALKGLINSNDEVGAQLAAREREFLTTIHHPNIVRIFNFVTHPGPLPGEETDYIVMEYVGGQPLHTIAAGQKLPVEQVIAYGLQILSAFEYLHDLTDAKSGRHGLLYCDMKPDNVIHTRKQIKLIDLGAVRWIGDTDAPIVSTQGFQVSWEEIRAHGLTVRSDLHTVGHTLRELFRPGPELAAAGNDLTGLGIDSFQRLLRRATGPFDERFSSAAEMSEQLRGVLREILSLRDGHPRPEPSTVFAPTAALLDAGLGAVPPLERWTHPAGRTSLLDPSMPAPPAVAVRLPTPRVDPADPAADFLANVSAGDPGRLIDKLGAVQERSAEAQFFMCRAHLELAEIDRAEQYLARAEEILGRSAPCNWRAAWHRGLLALAKNQIAAVEAGPDAVRERDVRVAPNAVRKRDTQAGPSAVREFDIVYTTLPSEDAPKLALGFCAEYLGRPDQAERYYQAIWRRDRSQVSAAFGLARIRLAAGDRIEAVKVLDQVPQVSRHFDAARIAAVRIHSGRLQAGPAATRLPTAADLDQVISRLRTLYLDDGDRDGDARARLTAVVQEAALDWLLEPGSPVGAPMAGRTHGHGAPILADPADETHQRLLLEASFRRLARQAGHAADHDALIDLANTVRPETLR
ncbi:serine/threonine-protein kinase [Streptosporangium sp. 'caverna']|uniref:serine/threonine-protein kinase n=1 Tax=Streptosporangium sp. 'caverna' TaxID=2202249 RepID=UPI000D7E5C30|nr:serine/threonine-protein kinase [Streptosporangium sp. 'caverna']AWS41662.1 serine/threonine protein kinase [Streptosporangium sp. 'caverna']